ncbi:MAG: hypothetical protein WC222_02815 [Parachlamydiales bacterium]|jgi:hypothetical protein
MLHAISHADHVQYIEYLKEASTFAKKQSSSYISSTPAELTKLQDRVKWINEIHSRLNEGMDGRAEGDVAALTAYHYAKHQEAIKRWNEIFGKIEEFAICPVSDPKKLENITYKTSVEETSTDEKVKCTFRVKAWEDYKALLKKYPELVPDEWYTNENGCYQIHYDVDKVQRIISTNEATLTKKLMNKGDTREVAEAKAREWSYPGIAYEDAFIYVLRDAVTSPKNNYEHTYIRIIWKSGLGGKKGVAVLPVCIEEGVKKIALVLIHRHAVGLRLEIPRGQPIESDKDNSVTAARETLDETGIKLNPDTVKSLGMMSPDSGIVGQLGEIFIGTAESIGKSRPDMTEAILGTYYFTFEELMDAYKQNFIEIEVHGQKRKVDIDDSFTRYALAQAEQFFK